MRQRLVVTVHDDGNKEELADLIREQMFQVLDDQIPSIYETEDGLELTLSEKHIQGNVDTAIEYGLESRFGDPSFDWHWQYFK